MPMGVRPTVSLSNERGFPSDKAIMMTPDLLSMKQNVEFVCPSPSFYAFNFSIIISFVAKTSFILNIFTKLCVLERSGRFL